jgi:hypothetical protein
MTLRELIEIASRNAAWMAVLGVVPPIAAWLAGVVHGRGRGGVTPWRYLYAVLVYLVSIPGVGAAILTAYTLFFTRESLLDKDVFVYLLPIVSMAATLIIIGKNVAWGDVPGGGRLSGLITLLAVTFLIVLAIHKTFIGIFFGASIATLAALGVFLFALLKWGASAVFRRSDEPPPRF